MPKVAKKAAAPNKAKAKKAPRKAPKRQKTASAKQRAKGEHPHTNVPRTYGMSKVHPNDTPSGVGLEHARSNYDGVPVEGTAAVQPNAAGGAPVKK